MGKLYQIINLPRSIPLFLCYSKLPCVEDIRQDLIRRGYSGSLWNLHQAFVGDKLYRNIFYCRSHKYAPILTKILKLFYRPQAQFGMEAEQVGGGMLVYHGYATIVFAKSIGKNLSVYQQVTVGRGKMIDGNDVPIIGDNVSIYAGAVVVGGIKIGNNAVIGAGAVVTKDVPENATVVGAPVRILEKLPH